MTRILSYNILHGGKGRVNELAKMIGSVQPDVVGLVEATDSQVVEELAQRLGMQHYMAARDEHARNWQVAVLSRLPIVRTEAHVRPGILTKPLLEVCVEERGGGQLTVFVTHLTAAFNQLWAGDHIRRREVQEILDIMASKRGTSHLLIGDFNALAPGDHLQASALLRYLLLGMDQRYQPNSNTFAEHLNLDFVVPWYLRVLNPLLRVIPRSRLFCTLFDAVASVYAPRGSISLLRSVGYVDCFRRMHPRSRGFTCPAAAPAGRIDFVFASPQLARRLSECCVVTVGEGVPGDQASDHFPVCAEFRETQA